MPPSSPSAGDGTPTVIFVHIPKTAGTTLSRIIERQYPRPHTFTIMPTSDPHRGSAGDLARRPAAQRASLRLVKGHLAFGIHEALPRPTTYFTMLRRPTARVLSHYAHARRDPQHGLHAYMRALTLKEVLAQGLYVAQAFDNFQTRLISGVWHEVPFGRLDEEALQTAKENLRRHFAAVGILERFDESILLFQEQFGWRSVYYTRHNTSSRRRRAGAQAVDEETLELVRRYNRLDEELYRFAAERCAQRIEQAGAPFQERLRRFQRINRLMSPFLSVYWRARKVSARVALRNAMSRL